MELQVARLGTIKLKYTNNSRKKERNVKNQNSNAQIILKFSSCARDFLRYPIIFVYLVQ